VRFHLEFLAWTIVKFVREEAVGTAHVANGRDEYVQENGRERLTNGEFCVSFKKLFSSEIHLKVSTSILADKNGESLTDKLFKSALST
jgi:hypothetical protein